jgi:ABC-type antimicrobial peptide transport system permease subunit
MNFTTIDRIVSESIAGRRFFTTATTAFASVALLLTITGLVVIVSRAVIERRRELAIRGALGATTASLMRLVTYQGMLPVVAGTISGLMLAYWGSKVLEQFLFQVAPREPMIYVAIALLIAGVAAVASAAPAFRVTATAPATVLRAE